MATWVTHFRIAEELLKTDIPVSPIEFLVGNIGPDCGLIGEDGVPQPPKEITHFEVEGRISADSFYKQYLRDDKVTLSREFSYYLGYYIHLVTDEKWIKLLDRKKKEKVYQDILNSPEYAGLVKKDWYGLDFLYLKHHKDNIFWSEFQHITAFPEYLSFFKNGQTFEQIQNIKSFYQTSSISEDHEFIYLKADEVNDFVRKTLQEVKEGLNEKRGLQLV
ncbi:zinc dependent phospholipase C family protein [Bacillus haikouensis]|uniref:zinc dependent phospholipase C family protein n=1 Tax=Bacillus haikouensis TaxID=1510468 RepID=UPI0015554036|nr:zinc dependent phospholipase C family protein [Bacillus haikouensis]NQD64366.1 zinc dependent phospholipase C family protein [Bacillus haikouensis]